MNTATEAKQATKCFGYLRVSGLGQVDGDGFTRQRQAIEDYASVHGYVVDRYFEERGVSGTAESLDRPAFSEMLEALFVNGVRTVVIERLDRFARDLMIQEKLIADFKKQGFTLISAAEPDLCAEDAGRVAIRQMMGVFAQYERSSIVAKLRGARQRLRAKTGHCEGRKAFGRTEQERATISRVCELHNQRLSCAQIAARLNQEGFTSRMGGAFHTTSVSRILERETVAASK